MRLPGATPDLVLLVVVALALADGPGFGCAVGFAGGLLLDLVPPADGTVGRWALVLTLVGWLAGMYRLTRRARCASVPLRRRWRGIAPPRCSATPGWACCWTIRRSRRPAIVAAIPYAMLYDVVLAAFVVPAVGALVRRTGELSDRPPLAGEGTLVAAESLAPPTTVCRQPAHTMGVAHRPERRPTEEPPDVSERSRLRLVVLQVLVLSLLLTLLGRLWYLQVLAGDRRTRRAAENAHPPDRHPGRARHDPRRPRPAAGAQPHALVVSISRTALRGTADGGRAVAKVAKVIGEPYQEPGRAHPAVRHGRAPPSRPSASTARRYQPIPVTDEATHRRWRCRSWSAREDFPGVTAELSGARVPASRSAPTPRTSSATSARHRRSDDRQPRRKDGATRPFCSAPT